MTYLALFIFKTATDWNGNKPKRPQTEMPTDRNGQKSKCPRTRTATNRNDHKFKRPHQEAIKPCRNWKVDSNNWFYPFVARRHFLLGWTVLCILQLSWLPWWHRSRIIDAVHSRAHSYTHFTATSVTRQKWWWVINCCLSVYTPTHRCANIWLLLQNYAAYIPHRND